MLITLFRDWLQRTLIIGNKNVLRDSLANPMGYYNASSEYCDCDNPKIQLSTNRYLCAGGSQVSLKRTINP